MGSTIGAIILGIVSLVCLIFGIRQLCGKGFLFNNAYIYATKEERQKMNKKPHYWQSGIILILISIIFAIDAIETVLKTGRLFYLVIALVIITLVYSVISSVVIERSNK